MNKKEWGFTASQALFAGPSPLHTKQLGHGGIFFLVDSPWRMKFLSC